MTISIVFKKYIFFYFLFSHQQKINLFNLINDKNHIFHKIYKMNQKSAEKKTAIKLINKYFNLIKLLDMQIVITY